MIKNIIFDWGGVIKDSKDLHLWIVNSIFEKFGLQKITLEKLRDEWKQPFMLFYSKYLPNLTSEELVKEYKSILNSSHSKFPPKKYSHIDETLKKFKMAGIKMIVLASDFYDDILSEIELFNLEGIFDEINAEIHDKTKELGEIIKRNNFNPLQTIIVGDSIHEIEAGKKFNMKTIAVTWGYTSEKKLRLFKPDFIVHNLSELESVIFNN